MIPKICNREPYVEKASDFNKQGSATGLSMPPPRSPPRLGACNGPQEALSNSTLMMKPALEKLLKDVSDSALFSREEKRLALCWKSDFSFEDLKQLTQESTREELSLNLSCLYYDVIWPALQRHRRQEELLKIEKTFCALLQKVLPAGEEVKTFLKQTVAWQREFPMYQQIVGTEIQVGSGEMEEALYSYAENANNAILRGFQDDKVALLEWQDRRQKQAERAYELLTPLEKRVDALVDALKHN